MIFIAKECIWKDYHNFLTEVLLVEKLILNIFTKIKISGVLTT